MVYFTLASLRIHKIPVSFGNRFISKTKRYAEYSTAKFANDKNITDDTWSIVVTAHYLVIRKNTSRKTALAEERSSIEE